MNNSIPSEFDMKKFLTREEIIERIKAHPKPSKYRTRDQIRQRIQESAVTNQPKRPKNVVWSQAKK